MRACVRVCVCVCVAKPVAVELRCHATALVDFATYTVLKVHVQLNLFLATVHSGDKEIAIDRWFLILE